MRLLKIIRDNMDAFMGELGFNFTEEIWKVREGFYAYLRSDNKPYPIVLERYKQVIGYTEKIAAVREECSRRGLVLIAEEDKDKIELPVRDEILLNKHRYAPQIGINAHIYRYEKRIDKPGGEQWYTLGAKRN